MMVVMWSVAVKKVRQLLFGHPLVIENANSLDRW